MYHILMDKSKIGKKWGPRLSFGCMRFKKEICWCFNHFVCNVLFFISFDKFDAFMPTRKKQYKTGTINKTGKIP